MPELLQDDKDSHSSPAGAPPSGEAMETTAAPKHQDPMTSRGTEERPSLCWVRSCSRKVNAGKGMKFQCLLQPQQGEGLLMRQAGWRSREPATAGTLAPAEREVESRVHEGGRKGGASLKGGRATTHKNPSGL